MGDNLNLADIKKTFGSLRFFQVVWVAKKAETIFISNPKCGCSSIKHVFAEHSESITANKWNIHEREKFDKDLLRDMVQNKEPIGHFELFTTVREPYKRLISAFVDKMGRDTVQKRDVLCSLRKGRNSDLPVTWDDFFTLLVKTPICELNPHWRPQYLTIEIEKVKYTHVFKLENIDETLVPYLNQRLGINLTRMPKHNVKSSADKLVIPNVSIQQDRQIRQLYVVDYYRFGYATLIGKLSLSKEYLKYLVAPEWFSNVAFVDRTYKGLTKHLLSKLLKALKIAT